MHPDLSKKGQQTQERKALQHDVCAKFRDFQVGNLVYVINYSHGPTWLPGKVVEKHGSTLYTVLLKDGRRVRDQLLALTESSGAHLEESDDSEEIE